MAPSSFPNCSTAAIAAVGAVVAKTMAVEQLFSLPLHSGNLVHFLYIQV